MCIGESYNLNQISQHELVQNESWAYLVEHETLTVQEHTDPFSVPIDSRLRDLIEG